MENQKSQKDKIVPITSPYLEPIIFQQNFKKYILNIYKTMLLRGILGTYIYVCDKDLRDYFMNYIKKY